MPRVALIQQAATADRPANLACFAELAFEPFHPQRPATDDPRSLAEEIPGPTTDALCAKAKEHGLVIARAPAAEDHLLIADLDYADLERSHARTLFLRDRRPEIYKGWLS